MREADLLPDWFVGGAGKRRLLSALLREDSAQPPWDATPPWTQAQLAAAAGLHQKHTVWRHVAVLVEAEILVEDGARYGVNPDSPLRRPLLDLMVALDGLPPRALPPARGGRPRRGSPRVKPRPARVLRFHLYSCSRFHRRVPPRRNRMARNERHIVPNREGGWDVKRPGASRVSSHHGTQAAAKQRAKEILSRDGGGEAVIHNRSGQIRDSDTVASGTTPRLRSTRSIRSRKTPR